MTKKLKSWTNWSYQKKKEHSLLNKLWSVLVALDRVKLQILTEPELLEKWELWTALPGGDGSLLRPPRHECGSAVESTLCSWDLQQSWVWNAYLNARYSALEEKENSNAKQESTNQELMEKTLLPVFLLFLYPYILINGRLRQTCELVYLQM